MVGLRHGHMGSIGTEHPGYIQTFKGLDDVEVVAYFEDTETERLAPVATEDPGAKTYTSLDDLIANENFDVAMVGLPANEVPAAGIKLAEAGKHFYMEKQFARRSRDLAELVRAVRRHRVKVMFGYRLLSEKQYIYVYNSGAPPHLMYTTHTSFHFLNHSKCLSRI